MKTVKQTVVPSLAILTFAFWPLLVSCATGTENTNSNQDNTAGSGAGNTTDANDIATGGQEQGSGGSGTAGDGPTGGCAGTSVTEGGEEGQCCDASNYQATCINDNANALVCLVNSGVGKVHKWTCADNGCVPAEDAKDVICPTSNQCVLPPDLVATKTYTKDQPCPEELNKSGLCKADKSEGYYCKKNPENPSERVVGVLECKKNDCVIDSTPGERCGYVMCESQNPAGKCELPNPQTTTETYQKDTPCPEAIKSTNGLCKMDRSEGYFCTSQGKIAVKKCANKDCMLDPTPGYTCGYVRCESELNVECNEPKVTSGGKEGDCCDKSTYVPDGCIDNKHGLYCTSSGVVAIWSCTTPKECSYDAAAKWYSCK